MEVKTLLYGENAWQTPARFEPDPDRDEPLSLARFGLVAGVEPSYNNFCDLDRMLQTLTHISAAFEVNGFPVPYIAVAVKHGNACGAAVGYHAEEVVKKMIEGDLIAIHGGLVILNFYVCSEQAEVLLSYRMPPGQRRLLDGIAAASFDGESIEMLKRKKDKCRFLANRALVEVEGVASLDIARRFRYVRGGKLTQPNYTYVPRFSELSWVCGEQTPELTRDFCLGWGVGSTSTSNTLTAVRNGAVEANGVGQQDRVFAGWILGLRSRRMGRNLKGCSVYSDSFFPFDDGPKFLIKRGVSAIFTSSGSVKDKDTIKVCQDAGVTLCMVPDKEGRGFYGH